MILLCYVLGLVSLHFRLRKYGETVQSLLMVGYNYVVVTVLYFWIQFPTGGDALEIFRTFLLCMYQGIAAIGFEGSPDLFADPQYVCIFLIIVVYTIRAVLIVFFRSLVNRMVMRFRLHRAKEVYLAAGSRPDVLALITDIQKHVKRAAIAYLLTGEKEADGEPIPGALQVGEEWLKVLDPRKSYHIILLPDDSHDNIWRLQRLNALNVSKANLQVTAFLDNDLIRFEDLCFEHLDAYLVSREQLLVRRLFAAHLPLKILKERDSGRVEKGVFRPDLPFSLCVIGLEDLGEEFLLATYENTAFETGAPDKRGMEALVLDEALSRKKAQFLRDVPQLAKEPGIVWKEAAYGSEEFFAAIEERLAGLHQILIATKDTKRNVELAMHLLRICRKRGMSGSLPQMIVALHGESQGSMVLLEQEKNVVFQQVGQEQFTYEELVLRGADQEAEELHRKYQGRNLHIGNWDSLGTFTQNSNRAVVWDIPNKLLLAGDVRELSQEDLEALCWQMARYEHRRWNAFHYSRGWTKLPVEELTQEEREACATKHREEKRHTCLVEWEELDALPQSEPGILKRYDYENVARLLMGRRGIK